MTPTHCEVCGQSKLETSPSTWGDVQWCLNCHLREVTYYRRDGERFGYPAAWGDLIGVIPYPSSLKENRDEQDDKYSNCYYIFRATDGTVRRARVKTEDFVEPGTPTATVAPTKVRPDHLRGGIKSYLSWIVDLMPITKSNTDDDG